MEQMVEQASSTGAPAEGGMAATGTPLMADAAVENGAQPYMDAPEPAPPEALEHAPGSHALISERVEAAAGNMALSPAMVQELAQKPVVARIGKELFQSMLDGEAPEHVPVAEYVQVYPQFLSDCARFGVRAALRTVHALKELQAQQKSDLIRAARNGALPGATRPSYNAQSSGEVDYTHMSNAEFLREKERLKEAYLSGRTR